MIKYVGALSFFLLSQNLWAMSEEKIIEKVKYYLTNGEARLARAYLTKLSFAEKKNKSVVDYYRAIFLFNENKTKESLALLNTDEFKDEKKLAEVCYLKTLLEIKHKSPEVFDNWRKCKNLNAKKLNSQELNWMDVLIDLLFVDPVKTKKDIVSKSLKNLSNPELKSILKLSLFLGVEGELLNQIPELRIEQLSDTEIRDIIGQIYFRQNKFKLAYKYIDDLNEPNSENMKGNLYLLRGNYDLAFLQFKSALAKKNDSKNAIERLIPLSIIMKDYDYGSKMINQYQVDKDWDDHKKVIQALFLLKAEKFQESLKRIDQIQSITRIRNERDINQISALNFLLSKQREKLILPAHRACDAGDYIFCYMITQFKKWENLELVIDRTDKIHSASKWKELTQKTFDQPIDEKIYVNQIDIEELDERDLTLFKSP